MYEEQRILITQAAAGMVLSRAVSMPNKVVLCAAGQELSETIIQRLASRGIKRIWVKGRPVAGPGPMAFAESLERLRERFARCRDVQFMADLERQVEHCVVRRR
jgi:hypothetical protein